MTGSRRWGRSLATAVLIALVGLAALLAIEVALARRGPMLEGGPLDLDGSVGAGGGEPLRVVWLGDSTAAGVGVDDPSEALPTVVAEQLGRPVDLTVLAASGDRVEDVLDEQLPAVAALEPHVVLISVGANDVTHLTTRADFRDRYQEVLAGLPDGSDVVLLGVPDMGAIPRLGQPLRAITGLRGRQLDEVVRDLAGDAGATHVPIGPATGPAFRAEPERYFAADEYHPSAVGYRLWADVVTAEIPSLVS